MQGEKRFPGVDPRLNSFVQLPGEWESFHAAHIIYLVEVLDNILPPNYTAVPERGLQISRVTLPEDTTHITRLKPDVTFYHQPTQPLNSGLAVIAPDKQLPLVEIQADTEDDEPLTSVVIYRFQSGIRGKAVCRLELLSPANKPGGSYYSEYMRKRLESLKAGLNLVELDYLHETPPLVDTILPYPDHADAKPFYILVSAPKPTYQKGFGSIYTFDLQSPLPVIAIPLADEDEIALDLAIAYEATYSKNRFYRQLVASQNLPHHIERYRMADQKYIRMQSGYEESLKTDE